MANRILQSTLRKIYKNGDIDTIYLKSRAKDVKVDDSTTMADIAEKVNGIETGATKTEKSDSNGYVVINGITTAVYVHPTSGVAAGTYNSVTVDKNGHVTKGTAITDWTGTVSGDTSNATEAFEVASTRENIKTGESHNVIFAKIAKFFGDLKNMAFVDSVGTANLDTTLTTFYNNAIQTSNVTTSTSITAAGWVADARAIASLQNQINTINSNMVAHDIEDSAAGHNSIWRFYDLTDAYNSGDFSKWVASGKFYNIFPGCYIRKTKVIDGVTYTNHIDIIAECDPYLGKWNGSNAYNTTHHVAIVPYDHLGTSYMNSTNTSEGGFVGSYLYNTTLPKYLTGYKNAYGSGHFLTFGSLLTKTVNKTATAPGCTAWTGVATDWAWYQVQITLLSEVQAYGSRVWGGSYDVGEGNSQLAAFRLNQQLLHFKNGAWWLRAVTSSTYFARATSYGDAGAWSASLVRFVRPLLLLY